MEWELADTLGLSILTVGRGLGVRDLLWSVAVLLISGSKTACHTADIKPHLNLGYPGIGSGPEAKDFQALFSNKTRNLLFFIRMDFLAPGNALVYFRVVGR